MPVWLDVYLTIKNIILTGNPFGEVQPTRKHRIVQTIACFLFFGLSWYAYKAVFWALADQWMYRHFKILKDKDSFSPRSITAFYFKILAALIAIPFAIPSLISWIAIGYLLEKIGL